MSRIFRITFVRHGHVDNPGDIFYGRRPRFRLSARGRRQARSAARALKRANPAAVYSSPLLRARQTAGELLRHHPGMALRLSSLITEVHSPYEGRPAAEVNALGGDIYSHSPPPYEQPPDVVARALKFIKRVRSRHPGRHVLAVTHGDVVVFTVLWFKGMPLTPQSKTHLASTGIKGNYPATASLTTLSYHSTARDTVPIIDYLEPY